ncbi:MAG: trypsin-like peptidase domain-containing protein [Bowdeniella nasicola]|nr:trypsin-like peptidase domain-containing protein [Bowdeniella nasicola]
MTDTPDSSCGPEQPWIRPDTDAFLSAHTNPHGSAHAPNAMPTAGVGAPTHGGGPGARQGIRSSQGRAPRRSGPTWKALIATSLGAAVLASGMSVGAVQLMDRHTVSTASPTASPSPVSEPPLAEVSSTDLPNWEAVAERVRPSVVAIATRTAEGSGAGSGVILDTAGHILTNDHVIAGARDIVVTLNDGRMLTATARGTDPATDLAVITLTDPPEDLAPATFGDSKALAVGQPVVAVGNPLGLSSTVTTGIVSALNRPVTTTKVSGEGPFQQVTGQVVTNAIQLDASINPGNSGGPVFDGRGEVIGISSSIATLGQRGESGSIGLGFAIPAKLASRVSDELIASGIAKHAFLGIGLADGRAELGTSIRAGALVRSVEPGSPAAKAGVREGDIVTSIDDDPVVSANSLIGYVRQYAANDTVELTIARDGDLHEVQATLDVREDRIAQ